MRCKRPRIWQYTCLNKIKSHLETSLSALRRHHRVLSPSRQLDKNNYAICFWVESTLIWGHQSCWFGREKVIFGSNERMQRYQGIHSKTRQHQGIHGLNASWFKHVWLGITCSFCFNWCHQNSLKLDFLLCQVKKKWNNRVITYKSDIPQEGVDFYVSDIDPANKPK